MKIQILTLFAILCTHASVRSQDHLYPVASADASALIGKISNPVDYATGTLSVSVPIYNLEYNGLQVPIGLTCQASGVKVEDLAGSAGLGWLLTAGGKITRVVKGYPDEKPYIGNFCSNWLFKSDFDLFNRLIGYGWSIYNRYRYYNQTDSEPDLFFFEVPGKTGLFVFDHNTQAITIPYQPVSIEWVDHTHFEMTDQNGTVYLFGSTPAARESTRVTFKNGNIRGSQGDIRGQETLEYVSTWYLESIKDLKGNLVMFEYQAGEPVSYTSYATRATFWCRHLNNIFDNRMQDLKETNQNSQITLPEPKYLSRIITPLQRVEFLLQNNWPRYISGTKCYRRITVSGVQPRNNAPARNFDLHYSFFDGSFAPRLDKISEHAQGFSRDLCRFAYYSDIGMPSRDTYDVDHWGYYNGKNNETRRPSIPLGHPMNYKTVSYPHQVNSWDEILLDNVVDHYYYSKTGYTPQGSYTLGAGDWSDNNYTFFDCNDPDYSDFERTSGSPGADKSSSLPHTLAGTLKRVEFPTGGSTEYEYELHDFNCRATGNQNRVAGGLRIKAIRRSDGNTTRTTSYRYTTGLYEDKSSGMPVCLADSKYYFEMGFHPEGEAFAVSSRSLYNLYDIMGKHVYYAKVIEQKPDRSRTVYEYTTPADSLCADVLAYSIDYHNGAMPILTRKVKYNTLKSDTKLNSHFWRRGLLKRVSVYDADDRLISKTSNSYRLGPAKGRIDGYVLHSLVNGIEDRRFRYQLFVYQWFSEPVYLAKQTQFQGPYNLETETTYEYDTDYMVPTRIERTDCEGNILSEEFRYPFDYDTSATSSADSPGRAVDFLRSEKIAAPVEKRVFRNGKLIAAEYIGYRNSVRKISVREQRSARLKDALPLICSDSVWTTFYSDGLPHYPSGFPLMVDLEFLQYNLKGNPVRQQDGAGHKIYTVYDASGTLPVATVENADVAFVTSFEDNPSKDCLATGLAKTGRKVYTSWYSIDLFDFPSGTYYDLTYWKSTDNGMSWERIYERFYHDGSNRYLTVGGQYWIDELRLTPLGARTSSFTYLTGIGKTSEMDPNGRVKYWEYDPFGRLICIRDNDRNVIEAYGYNLQND